MKYFTFLLAALFTSASAATIGNLWGQSPLGAPETGSPVPGDNPLKYCGSTDDNIVKIERVDISPNPPTPGCTLNITASGELLQDIEPGAYLNLVVKYGYIRLISETIDVCENADKVDMKCPVKSGEMTLTKQVDLPKTIPPGVYHVSADVYTKDDKHITCLKADITFHPQKPGFK